MVPLNTVFHTSIRPIKNLSEARQKIRPLEIGARGELPDIEGSELICGPITHISQYLANLFRRKPQEFR